MLLHDPGLKTAVIETIDRLDALVAALSKVDPWTPQGHAATVARRSCADASAALDALVRAGSDG